MTTGENESALGSRGNDSEGVVPQPTEDRTRQESTGELLDTVEAAVRRFCVLPSDADYAAVTLWIVTSHVLAAFDFAPILVIKSAEKRSGKSRLLEVVGALCHDALSTFNASVPALMRRVDQEVPPTVLLDEADGIFHMPSGPGGEALRTLVNSSFRRGQTIQRAAGRNWEEVRSYSVFSMVAVAGIGDMPDTVEDRAVVIKMRRAGRGDLVKPFRFSREGLELEALREHIAKWAVDHVEILRSSEPEVPVRDRAADVWESLLAVAELGGPDWSLKARRACEEMTRETEVSTTQAERLLSDLRSYVFCDGRQFVPTQEVVRVLRDIDEAEWEDERLTAHRLARLLRPFGIRPRHNASRTGRGYFADDFTEVLDLYAPDSLDASDGSSGVGE